MALLVSTHFGAYRTAWAGSFHSAVETIRGPELRKHCEVLASDSLEGRETGTRGGQAAGAYLVDRLRKQKVRHAGTDGDYFQPFSANSRNILALMPGSDPVLKNEYVLVGAHYDHVGYGSARNSRGPIGRIHNGADDNASGVAALLELIDAFSSLDVPPRRSVLFAFWDAEEQGLLGSQAWLAAPTVPVDGIRLIFNIDMIGRLRRNRVEVYGSRSAAGLRQLIAKENVDPAIAMNFPWETRRDSDHYSFFARQIPYVMIFTGKHEDYHTPNDDVDKLNIPGIERITRLLFRAVYAAAQQSKLPPFRAAAYQEGSQAQLDIEGSLPALPSRLGVTWRPDRATQPIIEITEIDAGSPAEAAGLQVGDRIVEFDGLKTATSDELRGAVATAPAQTSASILRPGAKSPRLYAIQLAGETQVSGISCRTDEAEPDCAIVNRVVPGSPASRAAMKAGDRIQKINGHGYSSGDEIRAVLERPNRPLELEIEREGHRSRVRLFLRAPSEHRRVPAVLPH